MTVADTAERREALEFSGADLTKARERAGLSRRALAAAMGVPAGLVEAWEDHAVACGGYSIVPTVDQAFAMAAEIGVPVEMLAFNRPFERARCAVRYKDHDAEDPDVASARAAVTCIDFDGEELRRRREALGLSIDAAAERARVHVVTWRDAEDGDEPSDLDELLRILALVTDGTAATAIAAIPQFLVPGTPRSAEEIAEQRAEQTRVDALHSLSLSGRRFRDLRERKGLSVEALAERCGGQPSPEDVAKWEETDDKREPDLDVLAAFSRVLDVRLGLLIEYLAGTVGIEAVLDSVPA